MKKEKQIKSYQRKTKSGKLITVKAHSAKYDAADDRVEQAKKKKGAGDEFLTKAKKATTQDYYAELLNSKRVPLPHLYQAVSDEFKNTGKVSSNKLTTSYINSLVGAASTRNKKLHKELTKMQSSQEKKTTTKPKAQQITKDSSANISAKDFKHWYHYPDSPEAKATAKQLRKQLGTKEYNKLNKQADDSYSSRGHLKIYKNLFGKSSTEVSNKTNIKKLPKGESKVTSTKQKPLKDKKSPQPNPKKDAPEWLLKDYKKRHKHSGASVQRGKGGTIKVCYPGGRVETITPKYHSNGHFASYDYKDSNEQ